MSRTKQGTRLIAGLCSMLIAAACVGAGASSQPATAPAPSQPASAPQATGAPSGQLSPKPAVAVATLPVALPAGWQAATIPGISFGPLLAVSGERATFVGQDPDRVDHVWSSSDGLAWQEAPNPGIPSGFVARELIADGKSGLILVGERLDGEQATPGIWLSADGKTFRQAAVEDYLAGFPTAVPSSQLLPGATAEIVGAAAGSGAFVAFGDHSVGISATDAETGLDMWHSADGQSWTHLRLSGSTGYEARCVTSWKGGFAAVANTAAGRGYGVWLSADGVAWHKASDIPADALTRITGFQGGLVASGGAADTKLGVVPASWHSTDGVSWKMSTAGSGRPAVMFDDVVVAGDRLIGLASSHLGSRDAGSDPSATTSPSPSYEPPTLWITKDGMTWTAAGQSGPYDTYWPGCAALEGRLMVSVVGLGQAWISTGNLP